MSWSLQIIVVLLITGMAAPAVVAQSTHDSTPIFTRGNTSGMNGDIQLVKDSKEKVRPVPKKKKRRQSKPPKTQQEVLCSRCCINGDEACCDYCVERRRPSED